MTLTTRRRIGLLGAVMVASAILSPIPAQAAPAFNTCVPGHASGGALGNGGGYDDSCLPDGTKWHCETVYVMGFGGTNCFFIPPGDPRNP